MVASAPRPELPLDALRDLVRWFRAAKVRGAVIGGVAVSLLAEPRYTRDVDVTVILDEKNWEAFIGQAAAFGIRPRNSDALDFARQARVLLLQHEASGIPLDISMGALEFEQDMVERAIMIRVGRLKIPVATAEDLIILKAVAQRPQDMADITNILNSQKHIDFSRVRQIVADFATTLDRPEIGEDLDRLLKTWRRKSKKR